MKKGQSLNNEQMSKAISDYCAQRVKSVDFRRHLKQFFIEQWNETSQLTVGSLWDFKVTKKIVLNRGFDLSENLAKLILEHSGAYSVLEKKSKMTLWNLFDKASHDFLTHSWYSQQHLSPFVKNLIEKIFQKEIVGELFIDLIHLSIVSFYKKVNPILGGVASHMMDKQIRGFIRLFIPIVQKRAYEFVVLESNQRALMKLVHEVFMMIGQEPLETFIQMGSSKKSTKKWRETVKNVKLSQAGKKYLSQVILSFLKKLHDSLADKKVNQVLSLNKKQINQMSTHLVKASSHWMQASPFQKFLCLELHSVCKQGYFR